MSISRWSTISCSSFGSFSISFFFASGKYSLGCGWVWVWGNREHAHSHPHPTHIRLFILSVLKEWRLKAIRYNKHCLVPVFAMCASSRRYVQYREVMGMDKSFYSHFDPLICYKMVRSRKWRQPLKMRIWWTNKTKRNEYPQCCENANVECF